ncbi:MAG TPA: SGNH/GDSL hydrolase family protein [Armatimonadota bacterium]|jgi:lysophospholipase L1-like esterase
MSSTLSLAAIVACGCLVVASAAPAADAVPRPLRGVQRIVTLGDSITEGGEQPGGYVWLIRKSLTYLYPEAGFEVVNAGISGHKSTDMQARFQRDVLDKHPQLVTISVGVNDVWHGFYDNHPKGDGPRGVPLAQYKEKVTQMIDAAQAAGIQVVLLSTTVIMEDPKSPENEKLKAYNAALKSLARQKHCKFIDLNTPFHKAIAEHRKATGDTKNWLTADGVHMTPRGNRMMASLILKGLGVPLKAQEAAFSQPGVPGI